MMVSLEQVPNRKCGLRDRLMSVRTLQHRALLSAARNHRSDMADDTRGPSPVLIVTTSVITAPSYATFSRRGFDVVEAECGLTPMSLSQGIFRPVYLTS